jgi:hypothetical protein
LFESSGIDRLHAAEIRKIYAAYAQLSESVLAPATDVGKAMAKESLEARGAASPRSSSSAVVRMEIGP